MTSSRRARALPSASILHRLRRICLALPSAREELAWAGVRWSVRGKAFANSLTIEEGWPPAYASGFETDGPVAVLTVRADPELAGVLRGGRGALRVLPWGASWGLEVVGLALESPIDWRLVKQLIVASHRGLAGSAPKPKRRRG